jgi:hypothetical protein
MTPSDQRPIPESYWVVPGRFLAGEYPGSWDEERALKRLDLFLESGFNTFIDLTAEGELPPYASLLMQQAGYFQTAVSHQRFSIGDFGTPTVEQMKMTLDAVDAALHNSRKVYLHCWAGVGRTGTTVGCYLVRHGKTGEEALSQLATWWRSVPKHILHPRSPETDDQEKFILSWKAEQ